jgi:conjugal transfer ATP-binding protein TraC
MLEAIKDRVTNALSFAASFLGEGFLLEGDAKARKKVEEALVFDKADLNALLPYQYQNKGLFENKQSYGFGFELAPASGADNSLMQALAELLKTNLPEHVAAQFMMMKHPYIGSMLDWGFEPYFKKGGVFKELAEKSLHYHAKAAKEGYKNQANIPATLCDYRVYVFFSTKKSQRHQSLMTSLSQSIESELKVMGLSPMPVNKKMLASLVKVIMTPENGFYWPKTDEAINQEGASISNYCLKEQASLMIYDGCIDAETFDENGHEYKSVLVNCAINKYPSQFTLWQTPDLFSNIYKVQKNIACPFLISFTIMGKNQTKMAGTAKTKAYNLAKSNNAIQNFINPYHQDELADWGSVSDGLAKDEISLFETCYNLILFTDTANKTKHIAQAVSNYRDMGFELKVAKCTQWLRFLTSLPFMPSEGLWKGLEVLGETQKLSNANVASLLPVVADFKGSRLGILLPTYRNQVAFLDTFDDKSFPISNYNYITCGTTGSGKSHFEQYRIMNSLARGEQVFIIDVGDSYKNLCQAVGGVYVDAASVALNPFTLFDFEGSVEIDGSEVKNHIQIRDLISIMASPNEPLDSISLEYLLNAVLEAWGKKKNKACVDDVVLALKDMVHLYPGDGRLIDLMTLLHKYTKTGIYGHIFNGETPGFRDQDLVVFELGGLGEQGDLLKIVMFVMIVIIQGQFYHTSRGRYKRCVIDEAWRFLTEGDSPTTSKFIVQGFRTARKHNGGFGVLTQTLDDLVATAQGRAIKSCSSISHIFLQGDLTTYLSQYPDEFNEQQIELISSFGEASNLGFASMMVRYGKGYTFHRYFIDPFSRILFSTKGHEFEAIKKLIDKGVPVLLAAQKVLEEQEARA